MRLRNGKQNRAQYLARPAPLNRMVRKTKNFSLRVECAADYPHRIVKMENLQHDLLQRGVYSDMKPVSIFSGEFLVTAGCEEQFKIIALEHGFRAMELIEA